MKIAFCNEVFGNWPLEKQFEAVASAGYDGIELAPFTLDEAFASGAEANADVKRISGARRQLIRRLAEQNNLEVSGLHWLLAKTTGLHLTSADADQRNRTAEYFKDLIRFGDAADFEQDIIETAGRGALEGLFRGAGNVTIDMVYYPDINVWNGRESMQYIVKDYRIHS